MRNPFRRHPTPAADRPDPYRAAINRIAAAPDRATAFASLCEVGRAVVGCDGITIVRRDGDEVEYLTEDAISPLWVGQRFPIRMCVSGQAILARAPIFIADVLVDKRVPLNAYIATFVRSMAVVPIGRDTPQFALGAYWQAAQPIAPIAIERMTMLADAVAAVITRDGGDAAPDGRQVA